MLAPMIERDSCRFVPDACPTHRSIRLEMSLAIPSAGIPV
jgi:hypothetical protein